MDNLITKARKRIVARRLATGSLVADAGLALLDILLGMAIFALLIVIAVQGVTQIRQAAYVNRATSDVGQIQTGMEQYFTLRGSYPAATGTAPQTTPSAADLAGDMGVNLSGGDTINNYSVNAAAGTFSFCVSHKSGGTVDAWAVYDSAVGRIVASGRGAGVATSVTGGYTAATNITCA